MENSENFEKGVIYTANKATAYEANIPKNLEAVKAILYHQIGIINFLCEHDFVESAKLSHDLTELANTILLFENL